MTRPILVASIEHAGTMFTLDLFPCRAVSASQPCEPGTKRYRHFSEPGDRMAELTRECVTIVPLRHPDTLASSWESRGMSLAKLQALWERMTRLTGVFFFPIDSNRRDHYLQSLGQLIGAPLSTDWTPSNQFAGTRVNARLIVEPNFVAEIWT